MNVLDVGRHYVSSIRSIAPHTITPLIHTVNKYKLYVEEFYYQPSELWNFPWIEENNRKDIQNIKRKNMTAD